MEPSKQLSNFANAIQRKLRSILKDGPIVANPPLSFMIKSLKPLQIADSQGFTVSCQTDAPKLLEVDETIGFDDYQVDLELTADSRIKNVFLVVKGLQYGINHSRKERFFNAKFNLTAVIAKPSKQISGCLNRLRKTKLTTTYGASKDNVLDLVSHQRAISEPMTADQGSMEVEPELTEEHMRILKKLAKGINRNQLFRAAMKHSLKDLDARRTVRLMIFPDKEGASDGLAQPEKKCYSRSVITTLLNEYKK